MDDSDLPRQAVLRVHSRVAGYGGGVDMRSASEHLSNGRAIEHLIAVGGSGDIVPEKQRHVLGHVVRGAVELTSGCHDHQVTEGTLNAVDVSKR